MWGELDCLFLDLPPGADRLPNVAGLLPFMAGALMVNYGKTYFTAALPDMWLFVLGGLFVLVTLFLPRGVVGLLRRREATA